MGGIAAYVSGAALGRTASLQALTPGEMSAYLFDVLFLPGEYLIERLVQLWPAAAGYLALGPSDSRGLAVALVSATAWVAAAVVVRGTVRFVRELDRVLTAWARRVIKSVLAVAYGIRIALVCRLRWLDPRSWFRRLAASALVEDIELSDTELAVLSTHAELHPGYAMTAVDVASDLRIRVSEAERAMQRLKQLHLIDGTLSTHEGHEACRVSTSGRALIESFRARTATAG